MLRFEEMEVEAWEIKPVAKRARPEKFEVEDAENGPATERFEETEEDAEEIKPPERVERLVTVSVFAKFTPLEIERLKP